MEIKKPLWGGGFWTDGCFLDTVSRIGNEATFTKYVEEQGVGKEYKVFQKLTRLKIK